MTQQECKRIREIWVLRIREQKESGKTQAQWCEEQGLSLHTLRYWVKKLNREERQNKLPQWLRVETEEHQIVGSISLPRSRSDRPAHTADCRNSAEISIIYDDMTVRVPLCVPTESIAQIIAALRSAQ